jgi:hypothetical protein
MVVLWWCYDDVMVVLWWCYGGVMMVLWWCYGGVMMVLWWCYEKNDLGPSFSFTDCKASFRPTELRKPVFSFYDLRHCEFGRAIAQAVSRFVSHRGGPGSSPGLASRICGGQNGAGAGFLRVLRFPLPIFIPPNSPPSQSPGAGTIGHTVADVPSGPSMDSTPTMRITKNISRVRIPKRSLFFSTDLILPAALCPWSRLSL